jgi:biotin carboxyl carrier protein
MPATVVAIHVKPGDRVSRGQAVMLLDAMKMELPLRAAADGIVSAVHCKAGDLVQADAVLLELDA